MGYICNLFTWKVKALVRLWGVFKVVLSYIGSIRSVKGTEISIIRNQNREKGEDSIAKRKSFKYSKVSHGISEMCWEKEGNTEKK